METPVLPPAPDSDAIRTIAERYRVLRTLGRGGMGTVLEVEDLETVEVLALKEMVRPNPARLLRFKSEFRLVATLRHPNLVRLFELGVDRGSWFFTMERIDGADLRQTLLGDRPETSTSTLGSESSGTGSWDEDRADTSQSARPDTGQTLTAPPLPEPRCDPRALVELLAQVLDGLEHLHRQGVVHGDLKPSNVLVDRGGGVRLVDFGLASRHESSGQHRRRRLTGTVAYMAPELADHRPRSIATDLYALGAMTFELLTGHLPFRGTTGQRLAARRSRPAPQVTRLVRGVPEPLARLCGGWLARDPSARPSIAEARRLLGVEPTARAAIDREVSIGRQTESSALDRCLDRVLDGDSRLVWLRGESGLGKTHLASRLAERARAIGVLSFEGRCFEREQVPFSAFDRVVDAMVRHLRRSSPVRSPPVDALVDLAAIFPVVETLIQGPSPTGRSAPDTDLRTRYHRAFAGFSRVLAHIAEEAPVLMVLDDLHWAEEESLEMLDSTLAALARRVMVVALTRPNGPTGREVTHRTEIPTVAIELEPLPSNASRQLLDAVRGDTMDGTTRDQVLDEAAGNPFLITRLARASRALAGRPAPRDLGAWLTASIEVLSEPAERLLSLAAVAGREVEISVLQRAHRGTVPGWTLAIDELVAEGWLENRRGAPTPTSDAPGGDDPSTRSIDFYHDKLRRAAYGRLGEDRRVALHRTLAETLEQSAGPGERRALALCRHWREAGDREKGRHWALEAAHQAAAKLAARQAARLYRRYLDDPDPSLPGEELFVLWEQLGDVAAQGGEWKTAVDAYGRALELLPSGHERDQLRILRGFVEAALAAGDLERVREVLRAGLALLGLPLDRPRLGRALVVARLMAGLAIRQRLPSGAASPDGEDEPLRFLTTAGRALTHLDPFASVELTLRAETLGRARDAPRVVQRALADRAIARSLGGRLGEPTRRRIHRALDHAAILADRHQLPLGREIVASSRALLWLDRDLDRAVAESQSALDGIARQGRTDSHDAALLRVHHRLVLMQRGDYARLWQLAEHEATSSRPNFVGILSSLFHLVILASRRGDLGQAERRFAELHDHAEGAPDSLATLIVADAEGALLRARGDFDEAQRRLWALRPVIATLALPQTSLPVLRWRIGWLHAVLGSLAEGTEPRVGRRRVAREARFLVRRGLWDASCLGWRVLAVLAGSPQETQRAIGRALALSARPATEPYKRWLCIETARSLGCSTPDLDSEAETLRSAHGFWRIEPEASALHTSGGLRRIQPS